MNHDDLEAKTIENYDNNAPLWAASHTKNHWAQTIQKLQELLPTGKILEVGCGGGRDAAELIKAGYDYTGTDASRGMIAVAQATTPAGIFRHLSVYDLGKLQTKFDGFWACNVLLHIPRQRIGEALTAPNRTLVPNAVGLIVLKDGDGEDFEVRDKDGRHEERLFVYWREDDFTKTLADYGFRVVDYSYQPVDARTKQHIFFVAKEKEV